MKNKYLYILLLLITIGACTPLLDEINDINQIDLKLIDSVVIVPNHNQLIADGRSTIDLRPRIFFKKNGEVIQVVDSRLKDEWFEYTNLNTNSKITRFFSTKDLTLAGKTIAVKVKITQTGIESKSFTFKVVSPTVVTDSIEVPVIFHVCQTKDDIDKYGGVLSTTRIIALFNKMNGIFNRENDSKYPVGVNAKIKFKLALYNPSGVLLQEPGINRTITDSINAFPNTGQTPDVYDKYIFDNNLLWPSNKYLNIWLISERISREIPSSTPGQSGTTINFTTTLSDKFVPKYSLEGSNSNGLQGFSLINYNSQTLLPQDVGVIYKIQLLNSTNKNLIYFDRDIDFVYYLGRFFGLLPTYNTSTSTPLPIGTDYCNDTFNYNINSKYNISGDRDNKLFYKQISITDGMDINSFYFLSENIMDDISGVHTAISQDQYSRILWTLKNVVGRQWNSKFALTGNN